MAQESPQEFFEARGYIVEHSVDEDGEHWASLRSVSNPGFVVERYGRGDSTHGAALRAQQRWEAEQAT